jgi:hypothetical protein
MLNNLESERLEKILRPIYGHIREAILGGFRYRQTRYSEELSNHTPRTRACLVNDLIVVEFMKRKLKEFGIRVFKIHSRILFDIRGEVILHFKKLDGNLLSSNLQTEFAYAFTRQKDLPGIPSTLPRLIAGYIPNRDWTAIDGVAVTLPRGTEILWSRSLLDQSSVIQLQKTLKPEILKNEAPQEKRRIRRKGGGGSRPQDRTGTENV